MLLSSEKTNTVTTIGADTLPLSRYDFFGASVASAADIDGDALPDDLGLNCLEPKRREVGLRDLLPRLGRNVCVASLFGVASHRVYALHNHIETHLHTLEGSETDALSNR